MSHLPYSHDQLVRLAHLTHADITEINQRRHPHNRLGFAYQLAFVRLFNRFPSQVALTPLPELLTFISVQLAIPIDTMARYATRQQTISAHQEHIRRYLNLRRFGAEESQLVQQFLFDEACRLEQTSALLARAEQFLVTQRILAPAQDTLVRLIARQRDQARQHIYQRIHAALTVAQQHQLDQFIVVDGGRHSLLHTLKEPPRRASPQAILRLLDHLEQIEATGILTIDLSWLNNNYQRALTRYATRCSANRLRNLQASHRYATLTCFLWQTYQDTIDYILDMHTKLVTSVYHHAEKQLDAATRQQRRALRHSLQTLRTISQVLLDPDVADTDLRSTVFTQVPRPALAAQLAQLDDWLTGPQSHVFHLVVKRFPYFRQFAPRLVQALHFHSEHGEDGGDALLQALQLLRDLNAAHKRTLPTDVPLTFLSASMQDLLTAAGTVPKAAWECAVLTAVRDELKSGNIHVRHSKRFGRFDDFFMPLEEWEQQREAFFHRAGLPAHADAVPAYLRQRLHQAYDQFLDQLPANTYAQIREDRWVLTTDPSIPHDSAVQARLDALRQWLATHMRTMKLPDLLIQVDNEVHFTHVFLPPAQQDRRQTNEICLILAAIMAYGCNIGPYTMARLVDSISYEQIKRVTDWQLSEEAQRSALARVVNALSSLDVTQYWGDGTTSSSDGQRFAYQQRVLHQTYSHTFHDFAIEFYSFVADNYAPFYTVPIECTDRDAAYVLDGLLYNESDLTLAEHYTDTHGYTEINFAAFTMLGRRFAPRIRNLHQQRIYRIDPHRDYQALTPLVRPRDRAIHMDWIGDQWYRMGQFYASLESGHTTASTALKRLVAYSGKNHFYRANRELGRVFKTEYMLQFMSDPLLRQRTRRGLLKGEQLHALAREVSYGKQGRMTTRDMQGHRHTSGCLTLLMACIIYWQAKELNRVLNECDPAQAGIDVSLLAHISPIGWDNLILYGEYVLNQHLIQDRSRS